MERRSLALEHVHVRRIDRVPVEELGRLTASSLDVVGDQQWRHRDDTWRWLRGSFRGGMERRDDVVGDAARQPPIGIVRHVPNRRHQRSVSDGRR
jgi:hypothetical protein